jgi:hypothetical protein
MRVLAALASAAVVLAATFALPSCSEDSSATTTDGGTGVDDGGMPEVGPIPDSAPADGPNAASVEYRAGTRLHPIVTTGGGAKLFHRLHDALLDVDCAFATLGDGALHCAPTAEIAGAIYFTDAACTQRIVGWQATCAPAIPAKYALSTTTVTGCPSVDVLELGAASAPATTYALSNGTCAVYPGAPLTYRSVTRVVPPSELVAGTITHEARGKLLSTTYFDGADGSRQPLGVESSAPHAGPCDEARTGDGALRCAPTRLAFLEGLYGNAGCTTTAALEPGYATDSCNLPAAAILDSVPGTCAGTYALKYYDVGAKVTGAIYQGGPAACTLAPTPQLGTSFYAQGPLLPDTTFAALKHVQSAGTPLALDTTTLDTGESLHATTFWDPARSAPCTARKASDGKTRCMGRPLDLPTFADAACSQPLVVSYHAAPGCALPVPAVVWTETRAVNSCVPGTVRGWTVGAKVTPPAQIYVGSACSPDLPDTLNADYYAATAELAPSSLVELTEVTE